MLAALVTPAVLERAVVRLAVMGCLVRKPSFATMAIPIFVEHVTMIVAALEKVRPAATVSSAAN